MLNRIGAIIEPCGIPISIVLLDEYVLRTRVQTHLSDKTLFFNIETSYQLGLYFSVYKVVYHATHYRKPF